MPVRPPHIRWTAAIDERDHERRRTPTDTTTVHGRNGTFPDIPGRPFLLTTKSDLSMGIGRLLAQPSEPPFPGSYRLFPRSPE
ncbi:MAG: hypothetical protein ACREND_11310, partial [Gemmatimonadaceae bacterium]